MQKIIADEGAAVCGATIAELFAGVRSVKDEARLRAALADFQSVLIPDSLWEFVGKNQSQLLASGTPVRLIIRTDLPL